MQRKPQKQSMLDGRWQAVFLGILLVIVVLLEIFFLPSSTQDIPYSQFKQLVQTGQVADLKIGATSIQGTLLDKSVTLPPETTTATQPQRFTTRVEDPGLVAELETHAIAFSGQTDNSWVLNLFSWLAPLFVLILFWSVYFRRMGAGVGCSSVSVRRGLFLDTPWATKKDYSEEKAAEIDKEVEDILERAHSQVRELLTAQKPLSEKLAGLLLEKEVLEGEKLQRIIRAVAEANRVNKSATVHEPPPCSICYPAQLSCMRLRSR